MPFKVAQSQGLASGVFPRGAYCRSPPRIRQGVVSPVNYCVEYQQAGSRFRKDRSASSWNTSRRNTASRSGATEVDVFML